jgi:hypothetical protein
MTQAERTAEMEAYRATLAAQFCARRCACGAPAVSVIAGEEPAHQAGIRLSAGRPDRNLCTIHAGLLDARAA